MNRGLTSTVNSLAAVNSQSGSLNFPLIYLCFTYGVSCYFTSGLESPLINLAGVAYAAAILWPQNSVLQGLVGLSPVVRHELFIPYLLFLIYAFFIKRCKPYVALVLFALSIGGYGIFRVWYYADFLPNTFYLKDNTWIVQGLWYVYDTILPYQTVPFLLCMCIAFVLLVKARCETLCSLERLAMLVLALPVAAYVVKIGGDPRHFRYLSFPFILVVLASGGLAENFIARFTCFEKRYLILFAAVFGIAVASQYPRQLQQHPLLRAHCGYTHQFFQKIADAALHRLHGTRITPPWFSSDHILSYAEAKKRYAMETASAITDIRPLGDLIEQRGEKPSTVPITMDSWCQFGYLHAASPTIHSQGLTDPFLARTLMPSERPAHKEGLRALAADLLRIRGQYGFKRGAFDLAISGDTKTPAWIVRNIHSLRIIEQKVYNNHDFFENMGLAFLPIRQIDPKIQGNAGQKTD